MVCSVKILADSMSKETYTRITTFEIELPKVLLAEYNTHAMISRNFSSSRAIPNQKFNELKSFSPIYWRKNQSGMTAKKEEIDNIEYAKSVWNECIEACKRNSRILQDLGLHKEWTNRLNDWHVMAKGVTTATEWNNFMWLRNDDDAQPEIHELASLMQDQLTSNSPNVLELGEWHLPYIDLYRDSMGILHYYDTDGTELSVEDAIAISMARCAAVSYRTENIGIEKSLDIYKKLFSGSRVHASPACHQATPMRYYDSISQKIEALLTTDGITHLDKDLNLWSGNIKGWIQKRQLIPNNYVKG